MSEKMPEMVARVLKALEASPYWMSEMDCTLICDTQTVGEGLVRAVIAAMREPTQAMMAATNVTDQTATEIWTEMLDEALK